MEENRIKLRQKTSRLLVIIYTAITGFSLLSYFAMTVLEQDGIINDTKLERGIATVCFIILWSFTCHRLYRYILRAFDQRSQTFDALDAAHRAELETVRLRQQFMANISHEIRTPLNAIIGFSGLLTRGNLQEREREMVTSIQTSSENLLAVVNDILDFSKIEAGMLRLESIDFDLRDLMGSVQQMFIQKAHDKNLSFEFILAPEIPDHLLGDPTRVTQILVNLIGNALKFTERGGIVVTASPLKITPSIAYIQIEVRDTGIGIPADKLDKIFERFIQADANTTRVYGGTGLGLSIVQQLVTAMEGVIKVKSDLGKGAVFTVNLPFHRQTAQAALNTGHVKQDFAPLPAGTPQFEGIHLLVVEDNPANRRVVQLLLEEWNYQYTLVENGQLALDALSAYPDKYQLVLMDIQMPVLDGYEATRNIRHQLKLDIPVVAMTAHALAGEREKCLSMGMNDYISKPIRERDLLDLIRKFTPSGQGPAIDRNYLEETTLGNPEYMRELADIFLRQVPVDLGNIARSLSAKDLPAAARAAHNMKSTVGYMGFAHNIGQQLSMFEQSCLAGAPVATLQNDLKKIREQADLALEQVKGL